MTSKAQGRARCGQASDQKEDWAGQDRVCDVAATGQLGRSAAAGWTDVSGTDACTIRPVFDAIQVGRA